MDYTIFITVHVYGKGKMNDGVLVPHSKNYGICGKQIIAPMRRINGREFTIQNVSNNFTVRELWNWITINAYGHGVSDISEENIQILSLYNSAEKYLVFNGLRYKVEEEDEPLCYFLRKMKVSADKKATVQFLVCSDEGDIFIDDGIRYYMPSKESGRHHCPHVHVDIKHESYGSFSLKTGEKLKGNITNKKYLKIIKNTILSRQTELLEFWNEHTDGLSVDLNQFLGLIEY